MPTTRPATSHIPILDRQVPAGGGPAHGRL
jgi:hypothetical protein